MDTKHEAEELARKLAWVEDKNVEQAVDLLRRQQARIEELERALGDLMPTFAHLERVGIRIDSMQVAAARALLTKKD